MVSFNLHNLPPRDDLEGWQAGITFPKGMTLEQAVETVRPQLKVESGDFEVIDGPLEESGTTSYVILLQLDSSLMEGKSSFSADKDGVHLEIEMP